MDKFDSAIKLFKVGSRISQRNYGQFIVVTIKGVDYRIIDIGLRMLEPKEEHIFSFMGSVLRKQGAQNEPSKKHPLWVGRMLRNVKE